MANSYAASYERDGFFVVEGVFSEAECDGYKAEALRVLKEKGAPGATVLVGAAGLSPVFRKLADDPRVMALFKGILDQGVEFMSDKFVYKSGTQRFATPWHTDAQYWKGTRPKLSVWIALDHVTAQNGALTVLPGSHLKDWKEVERDTSSSGGQFDSGLAEGQWSEKDVKICEVKKGSAIVFSDRLVHGSCENVSGQDRYSIIGTYHAPGEEDFDKQFPARHMVIPAPQT